MDAVKFVKEYLRMCTNVDECEDCPVHKTDFCTVLLRSVHRRARRRLSIWSSNGLLHIRARRGKACFWSNGLAPKLMTPAFFVYIHVI